jgi:hypothetical protein
MCSSLTDQVRSIGYVATAIANGDLSQKVEIEADGEIAILKDTVRPRRVDRHRLYSRDGRPKPTYFSPDLGQQYGSSTDRLC